MNSETNTPLLNKEETNKFLKQMDLACRLLDIQFFSEVMERFRLRDHEDADEFLENAENSLGFWQDSKKPAQVSEVKEFRSRCLACVFGKTVKAYQVHYSLKGPGKTRIHYTRDFAVNFEIADGRLTDFGWCNAFLSAGEMDELQTT